MYNKCLCILSFKLNVLMFKSRRKHICSKILPDEPHITTSMLTLKSALQAH